MLFNHAPPASFTYVLKLSDIASALHGFSKSAVPKAANPAPTLPATPPTPASTPPRPSATSRKLSRPALQKQDMAIGTNEEILDRSPPQQQQKQHQDGLESLMVEDVELYEAKDEEKPSARNDIKRKPSSNWAVPRPWPPKRIRTSPSSPPPPPSSNHCSTSPCSSRGDNDEVAMLDAEDQPQVKEAPTRPSPREIHIHSERQRRKGMRDSFTVLQSLVPKLKLKHVDRVTVLTEVITYIQSLQGTLEDLEKKKADIMVLLGISEDHYPSRSKHASPSEIVSKGKDAVDVAVRISGIDVFITFNIPRTKGVWSGALILLQEHSIDIVNATLATSGESSFHCIHGKASSNLSIEGIDLQEKLEGVIWRELRRPMSVCAAAANRVGRSQQSP